MLAQCVDEKDKELFGIDIDGLPHLDACFYENKKYYKIISISPVRDGENITYKCTVRPVSDK